MPKTQRRWLTDKQKLAADEYHIKQKEQRAKHIAMYGEHVCTPDPNDPWSICHFETEAQAS